MGTTALNTAVTWTNTIENNVNALMTTINNNTAATDVAVRLWYSNNASGTFYLQLYYTQPGNWKGQSLNVYVNGATNNASVKRAMGYGTSKGSDVVGSKRYELANHLGNVLSVITDRKWAVDDGIFNTTTGIKTSSTFDGLADYYVATIVSYSDYDPFGTMQDGRKGSLNGEKYRFGYQGSGKDDEIKGEGNSYTTHYRLLDPRLGRWFSTDPVFQPWQSPYTSMDNNPVRLNDKDGDKVGEESEKEWKKQESKVSKRLKSINKQISKLESKEKLSTSEIERMDYLKQSQTELINAQNEMKAMYNDEVLTYHILKLDPENPELIKNNARGITRRNDNDIFITYNGTVSTLAHELKHGYQILNGEMDGSEYLYDVNDEIFAFKRGYAFDETYHNFKSYDDINYSFVKNLYGEKVAPFNLDKNSTVSMVFALRYDSVLKEIINKRIHQYMGTNIMNRMDPAKAYFEAYNFVMSQKYSDEIHLQIYIHD